MVAGPPPWCSALLAATLLASAARAAPVYPLTARLQFITDAKDCFRPYRGPDGSATLKCRLPLEDPTREAFEATAARLFRTPDASSAPDLLLEVSVADADAAIVEGLQGSRAFVSPTIRVRSPIDGEIARLRPQGSADVLGLGGPSLRDAFSRAIKDSVRALEADFSNSEEVVRWLLAHRIEPVGSSITWPRRGALLAFLDAGGGAAHRTDGAGAAAEARLGVAGQWFILQAVAGTWSAPGDRNGASVQATDLGVELGPVLRLGRNWEVRGGAGLHSLRGSVSAMAGQAFDYSRLSGSAFAAVQYAVWPHWSGASRLRFGLELREHFGDKITVPAPSREIAIVDTYLGVFVGIELPLGKPPA